MSRFKTQLISVFLVAFGLTMSEAYACAVCFGGKDDHIVQSISLAILLMVVIIGFVLAGLTAGAIVLVRREKKFAEEALD